MTRISLRGVVTGMGLLALASAANGVAHAQMLPQQPQQPQGVALPLQAGQVDPTTVPQRLQVPEQRVRIIVRPRSPFGF